MLSLFTATVAVAVAVAVAAAAAGCCWLLLAGWLARQSAATVTVAVNKLKQLVVVGVVSVVVGSVWQQLFA